MEGEGNFDYNALWKRINNGEVLLIDTRLANEYTKKHIPGSVCAPYSRSGWGSAIASYFGNDVGDVAILATNETIAKAAQEEAGKNGFKVVTVISDGMNGWESSQLPTAEMKEITPEDLYEKSDDYTVIDVSDPFEWSSGIIPGSLKIPMEELPAKLQELSKDKKYALVCASGSRSQSAALYMADNGFDAGNVIGGMSRWLSRSLPVEYE